jgi:hypothetical protein
MIDGGEAVCSEYKGFDAFEGGLVIRVPSWECDFGGFMGEWGQNTCMVVGNPRRNGRGRLGPLMKRWGSAS